MKRVNVTSPFKKAFVEVDKLQLKPVMVRHLYKHPRGFVEKEHCKHRHIFTINYNAAWKSVYCSSSLQISKHEYHLSRSVFVRGLLGRQEVKLCSVRSSFSRQQ